MKTGEGTLLMPGDDFDAIAVLNLPKGGFDIPTQPGVYEDPRLANEWGRDMLIKMVQERGVEAFITRGRGYYDQQGEVRLLRPHLDGTASIPRVEQLGHHSLTGIGVIHNIAAHLDIGEEPPQLNAGSVRSLARDKFETASLLEKAGLHDGSVAVSPGELDVDLYDVFMGESVFIKPRFGSRSEGVLGVVQKQKLDIAKILNGKDRDYVVENVVDYSHRWPASIRAVDEENQAILDRANQEGANKELRAYSFGDDQFLFVGRAARAGETDFAADDWVFLDQDSIPDEARTVARSVYQQFATATGINEMHLGIDMAYAPTQSSNGELTWSAREVNAGEPQLAKYSENPQAADEQRRHLAAQIARIARKRTLA